MDTNDNSDYVMPLILPHKNTNFSSEIVLQSLAPYTSSSSSSRCQWHRCKLSRPFMNDDVMRHHKRNTSHMSPVLERMNTLLGFSLLITRDEREWCDEEERFPRDRQIDRRLGRQVGKTTASTLSHGGRKVATNIIPSHPRRSFRRLFPGTGTVLLAAFFCLSLSKPRCSSRALTPEDSFPPCLVRRASGEGISLVLTFTPTASSQDHAKLQHVHYGRTAS